MDHISSHIVRTAAKQERLTERGELMRDFSSKLNASRARAGLPKLTMPRMGKILEQIPTKDLYYLKSICEKAPDYSKKFWWEINPKNHTPEAKAKAEKKWNEKIKKQKYGRAI